MSNLIKTGVFFSSFLMIVLAENSEGQWPFSAAHREKAVFHMEIAHQSSFKTSDKTGFVTNISGKTYAVTTFQAIRELASEKTYRIKNKEGQVLEVKEEDLIGLSFMDNLAVFEVESYEGPVLELADFNGSDSVYMLGFPGGNLKRMEAQNVNSVGNGTLFGVRDIPIKIPGSSGGPVFDDRGKVIGVVSTGNEYQVQFVKSSHLSGLLTNGKSNNQKIAEWITEEVLATFEMAESGDSEAQYALAEDFYQTYQKIRDPALSQEAVNLYKKAAKQGHFVALMRLGLMYRTGEGVLSYLKESEKWLRLAVSHKKKNIQADFSLALTLTDRRNSEDKFQEGMNLLEKLREKDFQPAREEIKKIWGLEKIECKPYFSLKEAS